MTTKTKRTNTKKPTLIKCGKHYINPKDISRITEVVTRAEGKRLFVLRFFSDPNPDFACWIKGDDIIPLLEQFNIVIGDEREI